MCESRLPVGSSAKTTVGLRDERPGDRDALLLAARELGRAVLEPVRRARPRSISSSNHSRSGFSPAIESGSVMFSSAVSIGRRLKNWKMKPMCSRRSFVRSVSDSFVMSVSVDRDRPRGRLVEPGEDVHQRRLSRARRAHDRRQPAARDVERDAAERVHGGLALAVRARDLVRDHDRAVGRRRLLLLLFRSRHASTLAHR